MHYGGAYSFPSRTLASLYSHCGLLVQETGSSWDRLWIGVISQGCRQDLEGDVRVSWGRLAARFYNMNK